MNTLTRNQSMGMDIREIVRNLNNVLGATLVTALAGVTNLEEPIIWTIPGGPKPSQASTRRLILAHQEFNRISQKEGDDVARAFFIGGNPELGEDTPITALYEDRLSEFGAAVDVFLGGSGSW